MRTNNKNGFTLIELVIIMVILGILAAVAVPRLGSTIDSSQEAAEEAVIGSFRSAVELFAMERLAEDGNKYYPSDPFDALDDKTENTLKQADNNGDNFWNWYMSVLTHYRSDGDSRSWSYNSSTGEISSSGSDAGNSGPVYVDHDWCASYCYDLANYGSFENIPPGWWTNGEPVEECDCSQE